MEELNIGDLFKNDDSVFVLTADYKKSGDRMAVCLKTGFSRWFPANSMIETTQLFSLDNDNNIIALK